MKKKTQYLIPLVTLVIFILIMQGAIFYLTPENTKNPMLINIKKTENSIKTNQWEQARRNLDNLESAWKRMIPIVQFHAELDAMEGITLNIGRTKGLIEARDKGGALAELGEISAHWKNLTN